MPRTERGGVAVRARGRAGQGSRGRALLCGSSFGVSGFVVAVAAAAAAAPTLELCA